ncbi:TPA: helix-hairpin-helix domain-containing protein [Burkholderia multivorans]|uniref:ComEA family DNA-binding protein n=1 Tax=Burkholderia multivorans TaxID=87883 RepID=UPI000D005F31|nr:helix-hairpin-helix domain-containing protein [Burkholderia multivorans]MBU9298106.1 helix-hairpin-helix domain-containing protein [Burkholderia multivorans]MBU9305284.1 helix-hairpin-helix domain-containing protein [Burkholderia multivorans]MBU9409088.1 helix-hairpin-helix domain-containing protein [Burkholderia multivorans]MBU9501588.1 helix-hairpin-helix domain-containing protein [Burkholderia multivorans]MBU9507702.1 helix-hairpin-helix domain-containing protein [Burkholderia multivoran
MIRKWFAAAALFGAFASAWAAVDVNSANEDALMGIKGIGPARAKAILDERGARGPFKDAADLASRVKGMGGHTVERLQKEGLTVGAAGSGAAGSTPAGSPAAAKAASASPAAAKPAGAPTRTAQK